MFTKLIGKKGSKLMKDIKVIVRIMAIFIALILTGCTDSGSSEPTGDDIAKKLSFEIPAYAKVKKIEIEVSENSGSEVEPRYKSRFKGSIKITEPLYIKQGVVLEKYILEKVVAKGTELKIFGIANSTLSMDKWNTRIRSFETSPKLSGRPLSKWNVGSFVLEGSKEAKELHKREELLRSEKKAKAEAEKQESIKREQAEYDRLQKLKAERRAQAEVERQEQLKRDKEAQALRDKMEAEQKAIEETEKKAVLAALKEKNRLIGMATKAITGSWKGEAMCSYFNGIADIDLRISPISNTLKGTIKFKSKNGKYNAPHKPDHLI